MAWAWDLGDLGIIFPEELLCDFWQMDSLSELYYFSYQVRVLNGVLQVCSPFSSWLA